MTSNAYLFGNQTRDSGIPRQTNVPLQPVAKIDHITGVSKFAHSLDKKLRAIIYIRLETQDRRHAVHVVDDPPSLAVQPLIGVAEIVRILRERLVLPDGIEARLRQRL